MLYVSYVSVKLEGKKKELISYKGRSCGYSPRGARDRAGGGLWGEWPCNLRDEKGSVRKGAGKSRPSQQVEVRGEGRDKGPGVGQAGRPQDLLGG